MTYFEITARWAKACGFNTVERLYSVLYVRRYNTNMTMVVVERDGIEWPIWFEVRGGQFVNI